MANMKHEVVHHRDQIENGRNPPFAFEYDGQCRKLAVMLRTSTFPGWSRTTKNPPSPKIVWDAVSLGLQRAFARHPMQMPLFDDVLREYDLLLDDTEAEDCYS